MAKFTMYIDLYPGLDPAQFGLSATTKPLRKSDGTKRVAFDVTIPDEMLHDIDGYAAEVSRPREVDA